MSDTPRTDALATELRNDKETYGWDAFDEMIDLSRRLERDLNSYRKTANELAVRVAKLESENART